jgi:hypothetical protein
MNASDLIAALDLPAGARVNRRVPKSLLVEHGAPTAADRRRINDGVEEVQWLAALKPTTIGVPAFRDEVREYLEIAVLSAALRADAKVGRLAELVHRAVPYPTLLIATHGESLALSVAHKRWSQGEAGRTVLDGEVTEARLGDQGAARLEDDFLAALPLARQPRTNLYALYQGWIDTLLALLASRVTGTFTSTESPARATERHAALGEFVRLEAEAARLRAAAAKERQVARQVELNLKLKRIEAAQAATRGRL